MRPDLPRSRPEIMQDLATARASLAELDTEHERNLRSCSTTMPRHAAVRERRAVVAAQVRKLEHELARVDGNGAA